MILQNQQSLRNLKGYKEYLNSNERYRHWYGFGYISLDKLTTGYDRSDPDLVAAVKELGKESLGKCARLEVHLIED